MEYLVLDQVEDIAPMCGWFDPNPGDDQGGPGCFCPCVGAHNFFCSGF